jgi:F-type H+-transporting ATPase subunit delta
MDGRDGAPSRVGGYASAFFAVARAEGALEDVEDELFRISRTIAGDDRLRSVLTDAAIPVEARTGVVEDLLRGARPITRSLVSLVVGAGRARDLPAIVDEFLKMAAAARQREVAEVTSAVPLDDAQKERLAEALSKATGKQVEVLVIVDPYVLGGLRARVGDRVIDGTVRTRLQQLRDVL